MGFGSETLKHEAIGSVMVLIGASYGFLFIVSLYGLCRMRKDFNKDFAEFTKRRLKD